MWIKALVCPLKTDNESLIAALALSEDSSAANERAIVDRADPNTPDQARQICQNMDNNRLSMPDIEGAFHCGFHEVTIPERLHKLQGRVLL